LRVALGGPVVPIAVVASIRRTTPGRLITTACLIAWTPWIAPIPLLPNGRIPLGLHAACAVGHIIPSRGRACIAPRGRIPHEVRSRRRRCALRDNLPIAHRFRRHTHVAASRVVRTQNGLPRRLDA